MRRVIHAKFLSQLICCFFALAVIFLVACQKEVNHKNATRIITVQKQAYKNVMYYSGTMAPLAPVPVYASTEGVIADKFFEYGDQVQKGQLLFKIKTTAERSQFQEALTSFLKAKQEVESSKSKLVTTTSLFNQGIVPKNEFEEAQNRYYLDELSFTQAKEQFIKELQKRGISKFPELSLKDVEHLKREIQSFREQTEYTVVYAPVSGMALFVKGGYDNRVLVGSQVKEGDILCYVSRLEEGIAIKIKVNEIDVNNIQIGQKTTITGDAFPNMVLQGFVQGIIKQASAIDGVAEFIATISITELTSEQRLLLHIGMSCKVALTIQSKPQIMIPINAVMSRDEKNLVKVLDEKTGTVKEVEITAGPTTENLVIVIDGLRSGDKIVAPNSAEKRN